MPRGARRSLVPAAALQLAVYRLAQELTQNVVKHAQARAAAVEVAALPGWVVLRVEDDGQGTTCELRVSGSNS